MENPYSNQRSPDGQIYRSVNTSSSFFAKVMFFFGLAVLISAAGTYTGFQFLGPLFIANRTLIWIFYALELILVFTSRIWSTKQPLNYLLFTAFAFLSGLTIVPLLASVIIEFGGPLMIVKALIAATLTFTAAGLFGLVTQRSLSGLRGFLTMSLVGMIIVSILGIFIPWSNTFEMIFSGFGIVVFSGYTMYDFQRLKSFPADRPIDAALELYLDMFNLFLYILRLLSGVSRK